MAQETQTGALCQPRGVGREMGGSFKREGGPQKRGDIYIRDSWWGLTEKQQNSVKQLSFNEK